MNNQTLEAKYKVALEIAAEYKLESEIYLAKYLELKEASKPKVYYGTKYPDPRPCTKNSHYVDEKVCSCGKYGGEK